MARMGAVADLVQRALGKAVISTTSVAGGSICTATKARLGDGTNIFIKTRTDAPAGLFRAEAAGLTSLREAAGTDGPAVAEVLAVDEGSLILPWIEPGRPSIEAAEDFGRRLAALHRSTRPRFGAEDDGFIGLVRLPNTPADSWPEFYATRRVGPYLKVASDRGAIAADDRAAIAEAMRRLDELAGPPEPPAMIHGDLWANNLVWGTDGAVHLVDPAAHAGHRETDLAMLALFGVPNLSRIMASYEEAYPLADGWTERVGLHQLHPLLVHAVLFGGGYGARAGAIARELVEGRASA